MAEKIINSPTSDQIFIFSNNWSTPESRVRQPKYKLAPKKAVASYVHPNSSQFFKVISGELTVKTNGKKLTLKPGDEIKTSLSGDHAKSNSGCTDVEVIDGYEPAIDIEPFITVLPYALESKNIFKLFVFLSDFDFVVTSRWRFGKTIIQAFGLLGNFIGFKKWCIPHILNLKCSDLITV